MVQKTVLDSHRFEGHDCRHFGPKTISGEIRHFLNCHYRKVPFIPGKIPAHLVPIGDRDALQRGLMNRCSDLDTVISTDALGDSPMLLAARKDSAVHWLPLQIRFLAEKWPFRHFSRSENREKNVRKS